LHDDSRVVAGQLEVHVLDGIFVDLLERLQDGFLPPGELTFGRLCLVLPPDGLVLAFFILLGIVVLLIGIVGVLILRGGFLLLLEESFLGWRLGCLLRAADVVVLLLVIFIAARLLY
jgi:hypothetical protein